MWDLRDDYVRVLQIALNQKKHEWFRSGNWDWWHLLSLQSKPLHSQQIGTLSRLDPSMHSRIHLWDACATLKLPIIIFKILLSLFHLSTFLLLFLFVKLFNNACNRIHIGYVDHHFHCLNHLSYFNLYFRVVCSH